MNVMHAHRHHFPPLKDGRLIRAMMSERGGGRGESGGVESNFVLGGHDTIDHNMVLCECIFVM